MVSNVIAIGIFIGLFIAWYVYAFSKVNKNYDQDDLNDD
jgi:hypothetical protein